MAKKYISKYSNNKEVSPAQYITEIICEHKAQKDKKDLHYRFWVTKEWAVFYRNQIGSANKLLKKYSDISIVKALKDPRAAKIYSLRAPHLLPIIDEEELKLQSQNTSLSMDLTRLDNVKFQTDKPKKKSIVSKLKDIDNEY
jgi:hypothetical protein